MQDVPGLIRYPPRHSPNQKSHHQSAYQLAALLTAPLLLSLLVFWAVTHGSAELVVRHELIPQLYLLIFLVLLILPYNRLSRSGRHRLFVSLRRISIGGLAEAQDGKFGDILLADALTSYARVIGDLFVGLCMLFSRDVSSSGKPDRGCGKGYLVPIVLAAPSVIRFRQCLIEFWRVRRTGSRMENWGGQHLANALKYSTTWPVILVAAQLWNYNPMTSAHGLSEQALERSLYVLHFCYSIRPCRVRAHAISGLLNSLNRFLFLFINSAYSFYWDVAKDWDLTLFSSSRNDPDHPYGLRRHRYFSSNATYYSAIVIDLLVRFSWVWPMSTHFEWLKHHELGIFVMMFLEVARRWMWIFFRVEAEWGEPSSTPL